MVLIQRRARVPPILIIMVDPMFSYSMVNGRNIRARATLF